jgi:histidine phosphotransferase ChpT
VTGAATRWNGLPRRPEPNERSPPSRRASLRKSLPRPERPPRLAHGVIELAAEDTPADTEALEVAGEAAATLGKRLELLRAAWSGELAALDLRQIQRFAEGVPNGKRVKLDMTGLDPNASFGPGSSQLVLNALLLAGESLPGGGSVAVSGSPDRDVVITIEGARASWPPGLAVWLADEDAAWAALTSARTVQGPILALIARRAGLRISLMMPIGEYGGPAPLLLRLGGGA